MYTRWTSHLRNEQDKENFKLKIYSSKDVLERLMDMIKEEEEGLEKAEMSPSIYDKPNWDYRQAHANGFKAGLNLLTKMINLDQQEGNIHDHGKSTRTKRG